MSFSFIKKLEAFKLDKVDVSYKRLKSLVFRNGAFGVKHRIKHLLVVFLFLCKFMHLVESLGSVFGILKGILFNEAMKDHQNQQKTKEKDYDGDENNETNIQMRTSVHSNGGNEWEENASNHSSQSEARGLLLILNLVNLLTILRDVFSHLVDRVFKL